jgi:ribosome-binding protein aMBF1 (putative translation factor)
MTSKNREFIDDKTAEKFIKVIDSALDNKITRILDRQFLKDVIRFRPVGERCQKAREKKGLTIKEISAQIKIPQYRLRAVEDSHLRYIQPDVLEQYIDFLQIRRWFDLWARRNKDVYKRLKEKM